MPGLCGDLRLSTSNRLPDRPRILLTDLLARAPAPALRRRSCRRRSPADNTVVARKDAAAGNQAFDTNTLYLDYANNLVGAGTIGTIPSVGGDRLQVSGTVSASGYNYASTRTGYYFIPGSAFSANVEDEQWYLGTGYDYIGAGTSTYSINLHAPVNLPQGSTIETFTCYRYDANASGDIAGSARLYRSPLRRTPRSGT